MTPRLSRKGGTLMIKVPGLQQGDTPTVTLTQGTATKTLSLSAGDVQLGQINTSPASADLCSLSGGPVTVTVTIDGNSGSGQSRIYVPPDFPVVSATLADAQAQSLVWLGTQAGAPATIFVLEQTVNPATSQPARRVSAYSFKSMDLTAASFGVALAGMYLPASSLTVLTSTAVQWYDFDGGTGKYALRTCTLSGDPCTLPYTQSVLANALFLAGDPQGNLFVLADNRSISPFYVNAMTIMPARPATLPLPAKAPTVSLLDAGDLDGDKNSDIAVVGPGNSVSLFLQQASGTDAGTLMYDSTGSSSAQMSVQDPMALGTTMTSAALAVADIDQDGLPDLVLVGASGSAAWWVPRQVDGTYAQALPVSLSAGAPRIDLLAITDLDGDGAPDLVTATGNTIAVYINQPVDPSCPAR